MQIDLEKFSLPLASEYEIYIDGKLCGKIKTTVTTEIFEESINENS